MTEIPPCTEVIFAVPDYPLLGVPVPRFAVVLYTPGMDLVLLRGVASVIPIFLGFLFAAAAASRRSWAIVPLFVVIGFSFVPDLYPLLGVPERVANRPLLHAPFRQAIFLFGPFLWYYVARRIGRKPRIALHLAIYPAAVTAYLLGPPGTRVYLPMAVSRIGWFLAYSAGIVVVLRRYEQKLRDLVSNPIEFALPWLRYLIWWMAGVFVFMAATGTAGVLYSIPWFLDLAEVLTRVGVTVFLTGCWLRVLARPRLIAALPDAEAETPGLRTAGGAPAPLEILAEIERRFSGFMATGAFRDETLSLIACARRVGCPPQYLSYVLNHRIGERFSDHVAGYRVREVLAAFGRNEHRDKTILAIAYEAGFQSKSAFYDAFRRVTGTTPRHYLFRPSS
jgi:AraC-like DNA-binding protein